jgi:hypothetical protein
LREFAELASAATGVLVPFAGGSGNGPSGSVVGFSIDRALFEEHALVVPMVGRRTPDVVLTGEIDVVLSTMGAEDAGGAIGKAAKGQIAAAVERFWTSGAEPGVDRP